MSLSLETYEVDIETGAVKGQEAKILMIYTGGTFGMVMSESGSFEPFDFQNIPQYVPELKLFEFSLKVIALKDPIDSSDMSPMYWIKIASIIKDNYDNYDGFVVLHGTDTMAYSASALSFLLENLSKPVVFTGAQIPIGEIRSDARDNLISSLEIAVQKNENGGAMVPEVCIFFDKLLLRGNRAKKFESSHFDAFKSENFPELAEAGVHIDFREEVIYKPNNKDLIAHLKMSEHVVILKLFPGITEAYVRGICELPELRGLVIETYGSGNAPSAPWFKKVLQELDQRQIVVLNVSQCDEGTVEQGRYESSQVFLDNNVISGKDITLEAAVTKLMYLLENHPLDIVRRGVGRSIRGEQSGEQY